MARLTAAQRQAMLDSPWFGALPPGPRDEVLDVATLRHLNEGEVVYSKDWPGDAWYGILGGAVRLGASGPDGRQGLLTFLQPGTWFGDTSLFDRLPRAHDAVAHCPTTLLAVSAAQFEALLDVELIRRGHDHAVRLVRGKQLAQRGMQRHAGRTGNVGGLRRDIDDRGELGIAARADLLDVPQPDDARAGDCDAYPGHANRPGCRAVPQAARGFVQL